MQSKLLLLTIRTHLSSGSQQSLSWVQGASLGAHAHALTDIIDVASATIMVKKEKRIVCARWYELLREV
jgi:uncharacterized metal-binding protein